MGFWTKLRNLVTKGQFEETEVIEERKRKRKQKEYEEEDAEIEKRLEKKGIQKPEKIEKEQTEKKKETDKQEITEKEKEEIKEVKKNLKPKEEDIQPKAKPLFDETGQKSRTPEQIYESMNKEKYSEQQIHEEINQTTMYAYSTPVEFTGHESIADVRGSLTNAIQNTKLSAETTDIILNHLELFEERFTTMVILHTDKGEYQAPIIGMLPFRTKNTTGQSLAEAMDEELLTLKGQQIDPSDLAKRLEEISKKINNKYQQKILLSPIVTETIAVNSITYKVRFQ